MDAGPANPAGTAKRETCPDEYDLRDPRRCRGRGGSSPAIARAGTNGGCRPSRRHTSTHLRGRSRIARTHTIQVLDRRSTAPDRTLAGIWQSDQGAPRSIPRHGTALRPPLRGGAGPHRADAPGGARDGRNTCERTGDAPGHPDGHRPRRASRGTLRRSGAAVDREGRDQNQALGRGVGMLREPARQPDGVDVRNVSFEHFLNGRQVACRAANAWAAPPAPRRSRRPDDGAPGSGATGAGLREEALPTGPRGDVGGSAKRPFALGASKPVREEVPAATGERTVGQPAGRHGPADAANGTSSHHAFPPSCGITTVAGP